MDERHHYEVRAARGTVGVRARIGPLAEIVATAPVPGHEIVLALDTVSDSAGPDAVRLGYEHTDGEFEVLAELDGGYLSTEVAGGFTGRVIGMYVVDGTASFDWFDYEAREGRRRLRARYRQS